VQAVPDRLVLVGAALRSEIAAPFRGKSAVIHNSVSIPEADDALTGDDARKPLRVLTLAAFEPFKGYHHLADAVALVTANLSPRRVEFKWFGNTVDAGYLSHLRGIASVASTDVQIHDWVPDVSEELRAADLVVLPTVDDETIAIGDRRMRIRSSEGVPRCLLEAAAFGRATVATRVGGIQEAVRDGISGVLVPPSDAAALATAITDLLRDPDRRHAMGRAGREHVSAQFSHEALVEKVTAMYDELRRSPAEAAA
jgi:glycosyltransferase involved in cell wall biosynthesis